MAYTAIKLFYRDIVLKSRTIFKLFLKIFDKTAKKEVVMHTAENRNKLIDKLEGAGVDVDELRSKLATETDKIHTDLWYGAAMIAACSSLSAANLDNAPTIEQVGYLFDKCPDKDEFEHMQIVPLVYLKHCLVSGKLPPEEEWLRGMIERIKKKHGNGLVFKMLDVLSNTVPA